MATEITVAQQNGSGGEMVAGEPAYLLDAGYLDKEIAGLAASKPGVLEGAFAEYDTRRPTTDRGAFRKLVDFFTESAPPGAYADYLAICRPED